MNVLAMTGKDAHVDMGYYPGVVEDCIGAANSSRVR